MKLNSRYVFLSVGMIVGFSVFGAHYLWGHSKGFAQGYCLKEYPLTNPNLSCDEFEDANTRLRALFADMQEFEKRIKQDGSATRISIWVRDLQTNQWSALNETEQYIPASLLKLPLMLTYYNFAELNPSFLDLQTTFTERSNSNQLEHFKPGTELEVGKTYQVSDLVERMIVESDNEATDILIKNVDKDFYQNTLIDLGIQIPTQDGPIDYVTAKSYANIFRILYNASYLNRDYSEKALSILSNTKFEGLSRLLPKEIRVAHKFGERETLDQNGNVIARQLHDCGIVYKNESPYSICVMLEGKDFDNMLTVISDASKLIYDRM